MHYAELCAVAGDDAVDEPDSVRGRNSYSYMEGFFVKYVSGSGWSKPASDNMVTWTGNASSASFNNNMELIGHIRKSEEFCCRIRLD